jgi:hypothetical protein
MNDRMLAARDAEDLEVLSARLQDAVATLGDLVFLKKQHRFAGLFNRFKWEADKNVRVRSGLCFDGVLSVRSRNLKLGAPEAVVELLAVRFTPKTAGDPAAAGDPAGTAELVFAGDGAILLDVECLEAALSDESGEWAARGRPCHDDEEGR